MSGFVKRNRAVNTVNPAGGINPALEPNVSQYGWTTSDSAHVNQLIGYVNLAKSYSEKGGEGAAYIHNEIQKVNLVSEKVYRSHERVVSLAKNIETMNNNILVSHDDIIRRQEEITKMYDEMKVWKDELKNQLIELDARVTALEKKP